MSTTDRPIRQRVADQIEIEAVGVLPPADLERAVDAVMFQVAADPSYSDRDVLDLVDLVMAGWDLRAAVDRAEHTRGMPHACCQLFLRHMVKAISDMAGRTFTDGPLPPNEFIATRYHDSITIHRKALHPLTPEQARLLGVWLIALSDPTLKDAPAELVRVATR